MPIEEQYAVYQAMELPVAALVHSGGKSLHAIVRVDAPNYSEYQRRVDYLYKVCEKNGLKIDRQNRNPSRLSRMPGVMRNGHQQSLLAVNIGKGSWDEWREWIEAVNDDLPDTEALSSVWEDLPALSPALIQGVLRQGHKLLLAGPSKAGKSFALIELCIAIAEGFPWMGFPCARGRVLYVNLELDRASCLHRFKDVYNALGWEPMSIRNIDIWNLRGHSVPMDKLAPKLIRRASKQDYIAVVIDPIYKVITGDENSADQMAKFCNQFDKVCTELGCAVIYCHHHSKGAQGGKRSMDRASGSGVFARDPDALLDMIELPISEEVLKQRKNNAVCRLCGAWLERYDQSDKVSQDDLCSRKAALDACMDFLPTQAYNALLDEVEKADAQEAAVTAWRIEGTLREFPRFPTLNVWFEYPVHYVDRSGVLADIQPEAEQPAWKRNLAKSGKRKKTPEERKQERAEEFEQAFNYCESIETPVTVKALAEYMGCSEDTVRNRQKESSSKFWIDGGEVGRK
jgi:RecA-family ATPase